MLASVLPPETHPARPSISRTTRLPIDQANGPTARRPRGPRMPSTSTVIACGWFGGGAAYGGCIGC